MAKEHAPSIERTRPCVLAAIATVLLIILSHPARAEARHLAYSPAHADVIVVRVLKRVGHVPATWYGPGFWGNHTACGGTLRAGTWGIAHRTLPCGQLVRLSFGRRHVVVPVMDRGPYSGATIDLTQRTADYLQFRRIGVGTIAMSIVR